MGELSKEEQATFDALAKKGGIQLGGLTRGDMAPIFNTIGESLRNMQAQIDQNRNTNVAPPPKEEEVVTEVKDLNEMSNEELMAHIVNKVKSEQTQPLAKAVAESSTSTRKADLTRQANEANAKYPDFQKYMPEMKDILERHSGMDIERAYHLARVENPEKRDRIDAEIKKKEDETKQVETLKEKTNVIDATEIFGGLTPTSGVTVEREEGDEPMNTKEAFEAAWESTGMAEAIAAMGEDR